MSAPREPRLLYEPVLLRDDEEGIVYQAGAFSTEAEAQKVIDIWRAEGRREPTAINLVTVYESAEQWEADR
ncbi:hypothetical protein HC031_09065 [Planosporangium thailandense]|uniref:SPOR domain-containing protein n=1 Tax=Planosporangium thailandense TaxID=765197 RepID=A0ABX0XX49_9ACTN|nr:hypothetical protein [Planosporangium thailandense]NJC69867.1 hypothetical protein [Planosporangium thailandense]